MHIMIYGNPVDGFRYVGPFNTKMAAYAYAQHEKDKANVWLAELDAPDNRGAGDLESFNKALNHTGPNTDKLRWKTMRAACVERTIHQALDYVREEVGFPPGWIWEVSGADAQDWHPATYAARQSLLWNLLWNEQYRCEGVTGIRLDDPAEVHNTIAEAVGERS